MTTLATDLFLLLAAYGLALPVGYGGLPVLGQGAFAAVGAFGTFLLAAHGVPLLVAVAASAVLAGAAGYLVAVVARRLAGAALALATWTLAWAGYLALVQFPALSGGSQGRTFPVPARLTSPALGVAVPLTGGVLAAAAAVLVALTAAALVRADRGPAGSDWAALRTGPALAASLGVPVQRRRRALLGWGAALGAVAGAGLALTAGVVGPDDFSPLLSLQLFVAVILGGAARWWGPAVGVALLAVLPGVSAALAPAAGVDAVRVQAALTAVLLAAALGVRRPLARATLPWRGRPRSGAMATAPRAAAAPDRAPGAGSPGSGTLHGPAVVALRGVTVRFGAVVALDGVDLDVRRGEVHALVGPNGSGKSTALRVLGGAIRPDDGCLELDGEPVRRASPAGLVRRGVARTLQRTSTLGGLPAGRQVAVGARARDTLRFAGLRDLAATPDAARAAAARRARTAEALALTGLADVGDVPAAALTSAQQRMLQVARVVATGAAFLLLDEPAAGMTPASRRALALTLRALARRGHGVLLVEHDMRLVAEVADRVTVLAAGRTLATGAPAAVRADPAVRRAYLGDVADDGAQRASA